MDLLHGVERVISAADAARLMRARASMPEALAEALDFAEIVDGAAVPRDVVGLDSTVVVRSMQSGERSTLTLCHPSEASPGTGRISAWSPMGTALLGLPVGSVARWRTPSGRWLQACIDDVRRADA